ncbi:MAG: glutamate--tRNA ligase [Euryarchaeota archaeon]|nr:glutamate--tRNA ligase [Euryarchaeota archaeon]
MTWTPDEETLTAFRHLALQNAIEYEGKAAPGSVIGRLMGSRSDLREHGKIISPLIAKAVAEANKMAAEQGIAALQAILEVEAPHLLEKREKKERREGLPELKNAVKGKVVLRFAPNPNGPLSFGHARGIVINGNYAKEWDGELILRFDDTDTVVKPPLPEAYLQIPEEAEWLLGFKPHRIVIASEQMPHYYEHAVLMLERGFGYVCQCSGEAFKEYRVSKTECPCRANDVELNLELWSKMTDGTFVPGDAVVRVKTAMDLKNPALRDWPALRIQNTQEHPHPRKSIGSKYRVWPLLDFQSAVEDYIQGVTHIIRGKDLMDSTRKQTLLYQHFGWTYPETMYWGRVKVHEWGGFSTSQMRRDIEAGLFSGWDDPRLPTLTALRKRGITAKALRDFWVELGVTQKDISVPLSTLFSHNTKSIDDDAPRLAFIRQPEKLHLEGEHPSNVSVEVHPNHSSRGMRTFDVSNKAIWIEHEDAVKNEVRLKGFSNIEINGNLAGIGSIERNDRRPIIHWIPDTNATPAVLLVAEDGEIKRFEGLMEAHTYPAGTMVQLERIGYARIIDNSTLIFTHS